jgi:ABC-type branched-subunit amino acid transport system permease subunit
MKSWIVRNMLALIGSALGAIAGFFYWQQIGCDSGTCAITSNPVNSTLYGAVMGALLLNIFKKEYRNKKAEDKNQEKVL